MNDRNEFYQIHNSQSKHHYHFLDGQVGHKRNYIVSFDVGNPKTFSFTGPSGNGLSGN